MTTLLTAKEFERNVKSGVRDFANVTIEGDVSLGGKVKGNLNLRRSTVKGGFHFEAVRLSGNLDLGEASIEGDLHLERSHVGGMLDLTGCRVRGILDRSASVVKGKEIIIDVQSREYLRP